jgi:hypothetical protein
MVSWNGRDEGEGVRAADEEAFSIVADDEFVLSLFVEYGANRMIPVCAIQLYIHCCHGTLFCAMENKLQNP